MYNINIGIVLDYVLIYDDFVVLGQVYGKMGGFDCVFIVVKLIKVDCLDVFVFDGGDIWQGFFLVLWINGVDMVCFFNVLGIDVMMVYWEFMFGIDCVIDIIDNELNFLFLGVNIFDVEWDELVYELYKMFECGGVQIVVIGQVFFYMLIVNLCWMFLDLSFGVCEECMKEVVVEVCVKGVDCVVVLLYNGFDVDQKLVGNVDGIDVILIGYIYDVLLVLVQVNNIFLIVLGSYGKFVSCVDFDICDGEMKGINYCLILIFSDVIVLDVEMIVLVNEICVFYVDEMFEVIGCIDSLLYCCGNFNGIWDDLICNVLLEECEVDIVLLFGFCWGLSIMLGQDIICEDIFNVIVMFYLNVYCFEMMGEMLYVIMEDVVDNFFNFDLYY